ncbi:DC-STAMP domain-containing protein 2-like [Saccostrea echinata]|uniref:DC-STAMP domain-containing protein 2-like n=1 Tax=Saccostrea echinata TaxID=191078 RepID=UPI002A80EEF1|nr:DC-STAMP domain-containing protein 2-like [Saccostrea echinata]
MVHKRSPSQEPILPLEGLPPPEEPKVRSDWHTFQFYENPYLSGVYGAVGGILAGGALLGILWYFYGIAFFLSVYIAGPITVVLLIAMSLSVACRCIVCILVPEILGKYGRWVLYTLLLAVLVSGPVANISTNMERMSNSMGCSAEMIKNQTRDLKQQFLDPFNSIKNQMVQIEEKVRQYAGYIEVAMKPITDAIKATASGLSSAANYLKKAADECKSMFNSAYSSCTKFFNNAYKKCKSTIDKIPVIGSLRRKRGAQGEVITEEVFVQWNDKDEEKHRKFWETRAEEILEETLQEANLHPKHRLFDHAVIKEKYYNLTIRR